MATLKPAQGKVSILDKASSPLKNISKSFLGLGESSKKASGKLEKSKESLGKLSKKITRLNRSINAGKKSLKGYASGFGKLAGIGGFLLGGGLVASVNQQAEALDKLGKKAANLNLDTTTFQAMQQQAEHAGVSADELSGSMTRFTKRLGVLQTTGGGAMAKVVKKISPNFLASLKGAKTNEEAYKKLLTVYAKLPTQQAKMALADAAFGNSGRKSLLMLDEGVQGLINAKKNLASLGGLASKEDIQAAADYNDNMQDLGIAFSSIKIKVLTPVLKEVTGIMGTFIEKFKNADFRDKAIAKVKTVIVGVFHAIKGGIGFLYSLKNHIVDVVAGVALFKVGMFALNAVMAANPIGLIVAGVAAFAVGAVWAYNKFDVLKNGVDTFGRGTLKVLSAIGTAFSWRFYLQMIGVSIDFLQSKFTALGNSKFGTSLKSAFVEVGTVFTAIFSKIGSGIDWVMSKFAMIMKYADKLSHLSFGGAVKDIGSSISDTVSGFFGGNTSTTQEKQQNAPQAQYIQPQNALQTIQNNNRTTVPVAVHVNVADGKVKSVETQGGTKTDVFLNSGSQF